MKPTTSGPTYEAVTRNIRVRVVPAYLGHSLPAFPGQHLHTYQITISNEGSEVVQLLRRHWRITDGHGQVEEVRGAGVIGEQPTILPGGAHTYSSFCPLPTEVGSMEGTYQMVTVEGKFFDVAIPAFPLVVPGARN